MNNSFGELKVAVSQQLTKPDCKDVATVADLPPAVTDKINDGLTLLNALEQRGKFRRDDLSPLVALFETCELHRAAEIVLKYQKQCSAKQKVSLSNRLGSLKVAVAKEMTVKDCQTVATMVDFPPAERSKMKSGIDLMNALERKGYYKENDVRGLVELFTRCDLEKVAGIIREYQNNNMSLPCATPDSSFEQEDDDTIDCPDLTKDHMSNEIPDSKLAIVANLMGEKAKNFALAHLKLSVPEVQGCEYKESQLADRNFNFLRTWKENIGEKATYKKLAKLLHKGNFGRDVWGTLETADEDDSDDED